MALRILEASASQARGVSAAQLMVAMDIGRRWGFSEFARAGYDEASKRDDLDGTELHEPAVAFGAFGDGARVVALEERMYAYLEANPRTPEVRALFECDFALAYTLLGDATEAARRIPAARGDARTECLVMLIRGLTPEAARERAAPFVKELLAGPALEYVDDAVAVGAWQYAMEDADEARQTLSHAERLAGAIEDSEFRHDALVNIAQTHMAGGARDDALRVARAAAALIPAESPWVSETMFQRAKLVAELGDAANARRLVEKKVESAEGDASEVRMGSAAAWYAELGMRDEALRTLARARQLYAARGTDEYRESFDTVVARTYLSLGDVEELLRFVRHIESAGARSTRLAALAVYVLEHDVAPTPEIDAALNELSGERPRSNGL